jgi:ATP-dependent Lhr-like helicase
MDLAIEVPPSELGPVASNEMWGEIYDRLAQLANQHSSTLIFVNTRRLAERVAHHLAERLGREAVAAHHGSLSRKLRLTAERKLKAGEIRALVATASLELGIDIGSVDLVCQIGSPRSISVGLQRIGRAGHWRGAIPKGRLFATTRDDLLENAALVRAIRLGDLDRIAIPDSPMDILAQQIVAMCAAEDWTEDGLYESVRRAYPYRDLERKAFDEIVEMLSEGIASQRGRYASYLHRDRVNHILRGRRGARLAAITSGGAIPENSLYSVVAQPEGIPSARWTKILPSRVLPATSCCSVTLRGASGVLHPAACSSKTRKARRPACLSGAERLPPAPRNFPRTSPTCEKKSVHLFHALFPVQRSTIRLISSRP